MEEPTRDEPLRFGKRYRPIALLGSGGMGSVYLAHDEELDERVALKVLRPELLGDPVALERFRDEVRIARRVSSPLVARTHDLGEHEGRWFVTMQYVEGETLSARLRRDGRLPLMDALPIAADVCDGLSAVHAAGVVHRDLKPGNVLLSTAGHAVITDFGIALRDDAARTRTDGSGTPMYTAPEQLVGAPMDARADIFSLGAMLYAMVTGQKPFPNGRTPDSEPPDPRRVSPTVPDAFASMVMRAMALDPRNRYASSASLKSTLEALRPTTVAAQPNVLVDFVRSLGAGHARRTFVEVELDGVTPALGNAARFDLTSRLSSRDRVRVVGDRDDAEAVLHARVVARDTLVLDLALSSHADGYEFWRERLEGKAASLPKMIEAAAHAIERAFSPGAMPLREVESFPSHEVASLVLEARGEYRQFWASHVRRSIELFEQALTLAPEHPLVLAWCAVARSRYRFMDDALVPTEVGRDRELAERAVALAPDLPEARVALATSFMHDMRVVDAVPHAIEALRLAPGLVEQRASFARILQECGATLPAIALAEGALEVDPTFIEPLEVMIRHHALHGRMDAAARVLARAKTPKNTFIHVAYARHCGWARDKARFEAFVATLDVEQFDPQPRRVLQAFHSLFKGDRSGIALLEQVPGSNVRRHAFFHQLRAEVLAMAEDYAHCLDALDKASALGIFDAQWLDLCPLFDPLRGSVRFERLRRTAHDRAIEILAAIERCLA